MSTPIKDGGSAFPLYLPQDEGDIRNGMTLRDWFAGQVIGGMAASLAPSNGNTPRDLADAAFELADAMIAAREAKP